MLPENIRILQIELLNLQDNINSIELDIKTFKNETMQEVASEIVKDTQDDKVKPKYKTIQMRELETEIRIKNNDKYKKLSHNISEKARSLKEKNIELE
ncbi:hypothetical protein LCGC14_1858270, partial [marine sediment metagenome]